jgi:ubiquitin-conjugating enzyme E2 variant
MSVTRTSGPLYLECSKGQSIGTWLGAVLNGVLIVWSVWWLVLNAEERPGWVPLTAVVFLGLFLGDFFTGLTHWVTDTWFDEVDFTRVISIAREHHLYPQHILGYGFRDYVGYTSWPAVLVFTPILPWLLLRSTVSTFTFSCVLVAAEVCVISFFGTHFHRFGHRRSDNPVVRFLQRVRLLITPQYHALHHEGIVHDTHYCVVNGWANVACDAIGFWRGLEKVVHRVTGAVPRHNDREWLSRFRQDKTFMRDPVPSLEQLRRSAGTARSAAE